MKFGGYYSSIITLIQLWAFVGLSCDNNVEIFHGQSIASVANGQLDGQEYPRLI